MFDYKFVQQIFHLQLSNQIELKQSLHIYNS